MNRKERVLKAVRASGYDGLISIKPENVFYLTSHYCRGPLLLTEEGCFLYTSRMDFDLALNEVVGCEVIESDNAFEMLIKDSKGKLCLDFINPKVFPFVGDRIIFDPNPIYSSRYVKEEDEIRKIRMAASILDDLFELAYNSIRVGRKEVEVMADLVRYAIEMDAGFSSGIKPFIIGSGPNSSYPHAIPGERKIGYGEFVVVDLYLRYKGYFADATRTYHIGELNPEEENAYLAVLEAQEAAIKGLSDGRLANDIDKIARDILIKKGYEQFFTHGLGHGVGLEIHEPPWLREGSKDRLVKGNTLTVEPGVYIKERFGIRIEDTLLIGDRVEQLTKFDKGPLII